MVRRESGPDLIRCLGLLCVNGVHAFLYNGFYSEPQMGAAMFGADCFRWFFFCCNGIFLMLTGYLKATKPVNKSYYRGVLAVLLGYVLTCLVSFPIRHFLLGEKLTLLQWIEKGVTFGNYGWYVEMYLGLMLLSPLVNITMAQIKKDSHLVLLAAVFVFVTSAHSATTLNLVPDFWTNAYPLTYYVIGGVIRRLQPKCSSLLCLSCTALTAMGLSAVSLLATDEGFSKGFSQGYGGFWIMVMVTLLFLGLYRVQPPKTVSRVLAWAAGGCFEGYMLSRLLDVWVYDLVPQWHTPAKYPLIFLCITIPIYILSICMGKLVHLPVEKIMGRKKVPASK